MKKRQLSDTITLSEKKFYAVAQAGGILIGQPATSISLPSNGPNLLARAQLKDLFKEPDRKFGQTIEQNETKRSIEDGPSIEANKMPQQKFNIVRDGNIQQTRTEPINQTKDNNRNFTFHPISVSKRLKRI